MVRSSHARCPIKCAWFGSHPCIADAYQRNTFWMDPTPWQGQYKEKLTSPDRTFNCVLSMFAHQRASTITLLLVPCYDSYLVVTKNSILHYPCSNNSGPHQCHMAHLVADCIRSTDSAMKYLGCEKCKGLSGPPSPKRCPNQYHRWSHSMDKPTQHSRT